MNIFYFTERRFNKLNDYDFQTKYEADILQRNRRYLRVYLFIGLVLSVFITREMILATNIFLGVLFMIPITLFIEGYILMAFMKFSARLAARYMSIMSGVNQDINYDNVVN